MLPISITVLSTSDLTDALDVDVPLLEADNWAPLTAARDATCPPCDRAAA